MRWSAITSALAALTACAASAGPKTPVATLRPACEPSSYWDGHACSHRGDAPDKLAAGKAALDAANVDDAKVALDAAEKAGPLDREHHISLWEQRAIADAYVDDSAGARRAFEMVLALDPAHFLSYKVAPKATFAFDEVRVRKDRVIPELDVSWDHDRKVGEAVPLEVDVLADPEKFLDHATVFVRTRGEHAWRAADLRLHAGEQKLVLPPITDVKNTSLEIYLEAFDAHGNGVLAWADPARPREIPLHYEEPQRWYKNWKIMTALGVAAAAVVGVSVYELTLAPPDKIGGTVMVH